MHGYEIHLNQKHNEKCSLLFDIIKAEEPQINVRRPPLNNLTWAFADDIPESAAGGGGGRCGRETGSLQVDHVGFYGKQRHGLDLFGFAGAWRCLPVDIGNLSGFNLVTLGWALKVYCLQRV
jgi:hypothetical protein